LIRTEPTGAALLGEAFAVGCVVAGRDAVGRLTADPARVRLAGAAAAPVLSSPNRSRFAVAVFDAGPFARFAGAGVSLSF